MARGSVASSPGAFAATTSATILNMAGRALLLRAEPGFSLPAYERFAPPPPPSLVAARIEACAAYNEAALRALLPR